MRYPDLMTAFNWPAGVHRAPKGFDHKWLAVLPEGTVGVDTRQKARELIEGKIGIVFQKGKEPVKMPYSTSTERRRPS